MARRETRPPLVWSRRPRRSRRRPNLDEARIVRVAMQIADREGLAGISMRSLAAALGSGAMSLYRHVARKEDLLDLMLDAAYGEVALPEAPSGDWRADLAALARETHRVLRHHPWMIQLSTSRPTLGPGYLAWFEISLEVVMAEGAHVRTATRLIGTLNAFVSGAAAYESGDAEARRRHGMTESQMRAAVTPYLEQVVASGRYPRLIAFLRAGETGTSSDEDFEFGLRCVLEGLAAELCPRPSDKRRSPVRRRRRAATARR